MLGVVRLGFFTGGVASILRNTSSKVGPAWLSGAGGSPLLGGGFFEGFPGLVSFELATIGQALAFDAFERDVCALCVIVAHRLTVVPAEVEFVRVPLKMAFADAVKGAMQATLEDGEG